MKPQKVLNVDKQMLAYDVFDFDTQRFIIFTIATDYCTKHIPHNTDFNLGENSPHYESKNYDWYVITKDEIKYLIRHYGEHFTIFMIKESNMFHEKMMAIEYKVDRNLKFEQLRSQGLKCNECDYFSEVNEFLVNVHKKLLKRFSTLVVWNDRAFPKPNYVTAKNIFSGYENISSLDMTIFAMEEVFQIHLELYAQNDTLNLLKKMQEDGVTEWNGNKIVKIVTEDKHYDGKYYHGMGIKTKDKFYDVYELASPDCNVLYPEDKYETIKSFRVNVDGVKVGYATHRVAFMKNHFIINDVEYYSSTDDLELLIKALSYNVMSDNVTINIEKKRIYGEYDKYLKD